MSAREPIVKPGDVLEGRYRILKTLGEGGMGTVFLAEHALIKRRVAVKLLHPELATDAEVVERFMNEARAAGTLGHPNIVESTDMGFTAERVPFIVFEFLEGALLTDEIYRVGGFTVRRAVRIAQQIASALHAAHTANIVHRDLKSDNVFLTDKDDALDHVKVLDFGISRFLESEDEKTRRGVVMGTPEFMSPEQITAPEQVDRRTDVYALGVILYEMLAARRPFSTEDDPRALLTRIVSSPPPPLAREDVPHALGELIVNKMLAKDPAERYPSMRDVEAALALYATSVEAGGLRRAKTTTLPSMAGPITLAEVGKRPQLPRPATNTAPPWHQGRPDTDEHLTTSALPEPIHKRPWLLYSIAGAGVVVGAIGLVIGTRSGGEAKVIASPPVVIQAPAPVPQPAPAVALPPPPAKPSKVEVTIDADAPGARVTFRRRVSEAPAKLEINASDIVELVEVSAQGFKTERYWLTLDRPTHLTAKLAKGDGLVEATEEETLIALGELAAPAEPEPVAAPAVASAQPVARPRTVAPLRRKIGKAAAVAKPVVVASADAAPATPEAPAADVPATTDNAVAVPPPTADATGSAAPAAPAAAAPADPTANLKPAGMKADVADAPDLTPDAAADLAALKALVASRRADVERCFAEGRKVNRALAGTIRLELQVGLDGKIRRVQPHPTFTAPAVVDCIVAAAINWQFPERQTGDVITVISPFTL